MYFLKMFIDIYNKYKTDLIIGILLILSTIHVIFFNSDVKYDVYLYYEHDRFLSNIIRDCAIYLIFTILLGIICKYDKKFIPLFVYSLIQIICYFIFYNQMEALIAIPIYILTQLIMKLKYEKRNYFR